MTSLRRFVRRNSRGLGIGIFILSLILNNLFDFPHIWGQIPLGWVITAVLIVVLNMHFIPHYWAIVRNWVQIRAGFKLPDKENYTCKSDYILPFAGKWCVLEGGVTKELSVAWNDRSERFTYFFVTIDDDGNSSKSDDSVIEDYHSFGKDILAVADGVVVKVCNKHQDNLIDKTDESINYAGTWNVVGNHIIIQHSKNEYSCVGNLMRDSIMVKVGDKVKQGDVIAKCGNSCYVTEEPCIYFHLISSKSFYLTTSLPIAFTNIIANDSVAFGLAYENERAQCPTTKGNLEVRGNKSYIGRGLDVENGT